MCVVYLNQSLDPCRNLVTICDSPEVNPVKREQVCAGVTQCKYVCISLVCRGKAFPIGPIQNLIRDGLVQLVHILDGGIVNRGGGTGCIC